MVNHVYIHIPFCLKKCNYCSFCSFNLLKKKDEYIEALIKEINHFYKKEKIKTLYFGGGTPSLLEADDIKKIADCFNFEDNFEFSLEVNPFNIDEKKLKQFKDISINRLSVGVQSFNDEILKNIGRLHTKNDIFKTLKAIRHVGFDNVSIDLMYGLPSQDLDDWKNTLNIANSLDVEHISLYGLKIEDGTYFKKHPPKDLPNEDMQAIMYEKAIEILKEKYIHYEFSSFAKDENHFSKHNLCYWKKAPYYGFGLSASGYVDNMRYTNTFNYKDYIKNPIDKDFSTLSKQENIEEEIFLGLRFYRGINFKEIDEKYGVDIYKMYKKVVDRFIKSGHIERTDSGIKLTLKGVMVSNEILCEFLG